MTSVVGGEKLGDFEGRRDQGDRELLQGHHRPRRQGRATAPKRDLRQPNGNVYEGKADVATFLNGLTWTDVRIESYVADGDQVGVLFNYDRANGLIKGFDYFRFEDGHIREIRPYLNPIVPYSS